MDQSAIDLKMMRRCVELSAAAVRLRELPFSCVICRDGEIVAEAMNRVVQDADVTRHAEILAIAGAQKILGRSDLSDCTIYSSVEPCPMCSFPIRETRIGRVVYAISSPMMGGLSKWNVLGDNEISNVMPQVFGDAPEVAAGLLYREASAVWRAWNPVFWLGIRFRGCLAEAPHDAAYRVLQPVAPRRSLIGRLLALAARAFVRRGATASSVQPQADTPVI
jgi:tRNA(adenine34) deaminase